MYNSESGCVRSSLLQIPSQQADQQCQQPVFESFSMQQKVDLFLIKSVRLDHKKRLENIKKELDYIKKTDWMFEHNSQS